MKIRRKLALILPGKSLLFAIAAILLQVSVAMADSITDTFVTTVSDPGASAPVAVAVNSRTNQIYVANRGSNSITVIDGATNTSTTLTDPNAIAPVAIAVNPQTNRIYVFNVKSGNVTVIDGETRQLTTVTDSEVKIIEPVGDNTIAPQAVVVNPQTNKIYVANIGSTSVTVIDGATNQAHNIPNINEIVAPGPLALAVNQKTNKIYVANFVGAVTDTVTVINGATDTKIGEIIVGGGPQSLAVNEVTNRIYVANVNSQSVSVINGQGDVVEDTVPVGLYPSSLALNYATNQIFVGNDGDSTVSVINGKDNTVRTLGVSTGFPVHIAVNATLNKIYISGVGDNVVTAIDGDTLTPVPIDVQGSGPVAVAVNPTTHQVYVANRDSNNVSVFDGSSVSPPTGPQLAVSSSFLIFDGPEIIQNPAPQSFSISNQGAGDLTWSARADVDWLRLNGQPQVSGSGPGTIEVEMKSSNLTPKQYIGHITIESNSERHPKRTITVIGNVKRVFRIYPSWTRLSQKITNLTAASDPIPMVLYTAPVGEVDIELPWSVKPNVDWLTVDKPTGKIRTNGEQTINVVIRPSALALGKHTGVIAIETQVDTFEVAVEVEIVPVPKLCQSSSQSLIETDVVQVVVQPTKVTPNNSGGCDISASLSLKLPQNKITVSDIKAKVTAGGGLTSQFAESLRLKMGNIEVEIDPPEIFQTTAGTYQIISPAATFHLSALGASTTYRYNKRIGIGSMGLVFEDFWSDVSFDLPDLSIAGFSFKKVIARPIEYADNTYGLEITGNVQFKIPGYTLNTKGTLQVGVKRFSGTLDDISLPNFAGMTLSMKGVKFGKVVNGGLVVYTEQASMQLPASWAKGDTKITLQVMVEGSKLKLLGGGFKIPAMKVGSFQLASLEASLLEKSNGYEITAGGYMSFAGASPKGGCGIGVRVTIFGNLFGEAALEVHSVENATVLAETEENALAATRLQLRSLTVTYDACPPGVAIGTTGFYMTKIQGTVNVVSAGIDRITLSVWLVFGTQPVGANYLMSANATMLIVPSPFEIDFKAALKILGFDTAKTHVNITSSKLAARIDVDFGPTDMNMEVHAGRLRTGQRYISGHGGVSVGVEKGEILHECATIKNVNPLSKDFGKSYERCLNIPDKTYTTGVQSDFGLFKNGSYGISGYISKFKVGFFFDISKIRLAFGDMSRYKLIDSSQIQQAQRGLAAGQTVVLNGDSNLSFPPDGSVLVDVAIPQTPLIVAAGANSSVPVTGDSTVVFMLTHGADLPLGFTLVQPNGTEITPDSLPAGVTYSTSTDNTATDAATTLHTYIVPHAAIGTWQTKITGNTTDGAYAVAVFGNAPAPEFQDARVAHDEELDQWLVTWALASSEGTMVNIYAYDTSNITATDSITDVTLINAGAGIPLLEGLDPLTAHQQVDLSKLPTGSYRFWIEANDGVNPPVYRYLKWADSTGLSGVANVAINHTDSYPQQWTTAISVTPDLAQRQATVSWKTDTAHADVDSYIIRVRTQDPLSPSHFIVKETLAGDTSDNGVAAAVIDGINGGQSYYISIGAEDIDTQRVAWSQEQLVETEIPEFTVSLPTTITVVAGQQTQTKLRVSADALADAVMISAELGRDLDGITALFGDAPLGVVSSSGDVVVTILVAESVAPGSYTMPLRAESGLLEKSLNLNVEVMPQLTQLYLPILSR